MSMTTNKQTVDEQTRAELRKRYTPPQIPKCSVCGGELSIQRCGGGEPTVYACDGYEADPENPGMVRRAAGRDIADRHYEDSRYIDWKEIALEHAVEIERLRSLVIRVPMPVIVPRDMAHQLYHTETKRCRTCNDGLRGGCSSCIFNKQSRVQPEKWRNLCHA